MHSDQISPNIRQHRGSMRHRQQIRGRLEALAVLWRGSVAVFWPRIGAFFFAQTNSFVEAMLDTQMEVDEELQNVKLSSNIA